MSRTDNASVPVDNLDQKKERKAAQFQNGELYAGGHDDQHMSGVNGVIFNALKHYKMFGLMGQLLIIPVCLVGIMICDQHTVITLLF